MDFQRLFKLRLVVARFGEMDGAEWWNTTGALSRIGNTVLSRGFPRTDFFAQARSVFEVARSRCREVFNPPRSATLWDLRTDLLAAMKALCSKLAVWFGGGAEALAHGMDIAEAPHAVTWKEFDLFTAAWRQSQTASTAQAWMAQHSAKVERSELEVYREVFAAALQRYSEAPGLVGREYQSCHRLAATTSSAFGPGAGRS